MMKTTYRSREPYQSIFYKCADDFVCNSPVKPERFIRRMRENTGMAGGFLGLLDEQGLEKRNPVIVALGDSVTAGHFEGMLTPRAMEIMGKVFAARQNGATQEEVLALVAAEGGMPPDRKSVV